MGMKKDRLGLGKVHFRSCDALRLSFKHLKILERTIINIGSITLGIILFSMIIFSNAIRGDYDGLRLNFESHQSWLIVASMMVSIVSVANVMMISVFERFNEIGTLKCLGALDKHILMIFLIEAVVQGILGGATGSICGFFIAFISSAISVGFESIRLSTELFFIFISSISLSILMSIVAALYPAYRAAVLNPVEAFRFEF
jgi:predicted lysophospholipase L1 biosynthesis ABC-type transport system permease subunit